MGAFGLKKNQIDVFLVFSDDFDVLMSKIKTKLKKIILMHFQVKNTFEKCLAPQYQTKNLLHYVTDRICLISVLFELPRGTQTLLVEILIVLLITYHLWLLCSFLFPAFIDVMHLQRVTPWNVAKLRNAVINGAEIHPGATHYVDKLSTTKLPPNRKMRVSVARKLSGRSVDYEYEGKIVYRHLQDGDIVLVNRQVNNHPT